MKQKITLTMEPRILELLQQYADSTMQSRSRAVSMLVLEATKKGEAHGQQPQPTAQKRQSQ